MSDGDDAEAPTPAEPSPGPPPALPPPPERGWHPVPENPNYQRFWDGQKWGEQRYWGGGGATDPSASAGILGPSGLSGPDPLALDRAPSFDAPVRYQRGLFGPPLNPRSPARQVAVVAVGVILFFVYLSLHIFPGRLLVLFVALGLVFFLVQLPARLRFLGDPARRSAIREPITFQSKVWLRFTYAPSRVPYFQVGRWDLAVRTDSFQVTNWIFGSRNRARSTYFDAAEAVMWQTVADGRDGIAVSGPTYSRSKVEFIFSAEEGNAEAWNALARAGVRSVPAPLTGAGESPARSFGRIGSDLGTVRTPTPAPPPGPRRDQPAAGPGGGRRKPPIRAGQWSPAVIVGAVVFVLVGPLLLATVTRVALGSPATVTPFLATTECMHEPGSTEVTWSRTVTRTDPPVAQGHVVVDVEVMSPQQTTGLGGTRAELSVPADSRPSIPLGPLSITLPVATTEQVYCQASFAYPNGIG